MEQNGEQEFLCGLRNELDFQKLVVIKILDEHQYANQVNLLVHYDGLPDSAVLVIKKAPIFLDKLRSAQPFKSKIWDKWRNDIYGKFKISLPQDLNEAYVQVIYPANDKIIKKYSAKIFHIFNENAKFYFESVLPQLPSNQLDLKWVYNILEGKAEQDSIVYRSQHYNEDLDFLLSYDMKWNGKDKNVYLLALPLKRGIKSLRDLNASHLPLLKSLTQCPKIISERYDVPICSIKSYFHYPPSFYHLHIHFTLTTNAMDVPDYMGFGRNHFLTDVIQNIELVPDYYQKQSISVYIDDQSSFYEKYLKYC